MRAMWTTWIKSAIPLRGSRDQGPQRSASGRSWCIWAGRSRSSARCRSSTETVLLAPVTPEWRESACHWGHPGPMSADSPLSDPEVDPFRGRGILWPPAGLPSRPVDAEPDQRRARVPDSAAACPMRAANHERGHRDRRLRRARGTQGQMHSPGGVLTGGGSCGGHRCQGRDPIR